MLFRCRPRQCGQKLRYIADLRLAKLNYLSFRSGDQIDFPERQGIVNRRSRRRQISPVNTAQNRGFPRSRFSDDTDELSLVQRKRDPFAALYLSSLLVKKEIF